MILQKYPSLSNQNFKHNPSLNLTPNLSLELGFLCSPFSVFTQQGNDCSSWNSFFVVLGFSYWVLVLFFILYPQFKVNNGNTRTRSEICLKLTIKTPERRPQNGQHSNNSVIVVVGWVSFKNINKRNIETNQPKKAVVLVKNEKE